MKENQIIRNILTRRSVRSFKKEPLSREELETIVLAGIYAPTGMNIETRRFTVVTDESGIAALEKEVARAAERGDDYNFYGPSAFIMVSEETDNRNGLANCACALENMMLAAWSLGIGSVWINQFKLVCDDAGIRALLDALEIPANHTVWGCLSLGYPEREPERRKKDESVVRWF